MMNNPRHAMSPCRAMKLYVRSFIDDQTFSDPDTLNAVMENTTEKFRDLIFNIFFPGESGEQFPRLKWLLEFWAKTGK